MSYSDKDILKALSNVIDPDLGKDLVTLNMIRNLKIEGKEIFFDLVLTTPACPLKTALENACKNAIKHLVDKDAIIHMNTTSDVTSTKSSSEDALPDVKNVIAVASGKGGVGKSTIAVNIAISLAKNGAKVGLIDADIYGPSIPIMFGMKGVKPQAKKIDEKTYMVPFEKYGIQFISIGFFMDEEQSLPWRGPMASSAIRQFINDTLWGELDYMVIDLPPGTGDIQLTLASAVSITGAVVVSTPQDVALADVKKAIDMFQNPKINIPIIGVIENMSYFSPEDMPDKKYYIFGKGGTEKLAQEKEIEFLGSLPIIERISESCDSGSPISLHEGSESAILFKELSEKVAQQISIINNTKETKPEETTA